MKPFQNCPHCSGELFSTVRTYKHDWHTCDSCGTMQRERRPSCALDFFPIRQLIENTALNKIWGRTLIREREMVSDEALFYEYYDKCAKDGVKGTKWEPLTPFRLNDFAKLGIDLTGKEVLEISGGPGFLAQAMKPIAKRVVVTEFNQIAANGMARTLDIEAVKYDYNTDELSQCVSGKFDVILIIYSIGFCNDIRAFAKSLRPVMNDGAVVYVCHVPPTLGQMLRWEFDEYTYTRSWPEDVLTTTFAEAGLVQTTREDEGSYPYDHHWYDTAGTKAGKWLKRLHHTIATYFREEALNTPGKFNRELVQKNIKQTFRLA